MRKKFDKSAFSLIELFVVIASIVILFMFTIPKMTFFNKFILQNEADKLFTVFSFLQQRSIASNKPCKLFFDIKQNSYSYDLENKLHVHKLPEVVKFGFLHGVYGPPSDPTQQIAEAITFKTEGKNELSVTFFPDGKIQPGTIYLVDRDQKFMMAITCPISNVSYIRKYRFDSGKWNCLSG